MISVYLLEFAFTFMIFPAVEAKLKSSTLRKNFSYDFFVNLCQHLIYK